MKSVILTRLKFHRWRKKAWRKPLSQQELDDLDLAWENMGEDESSDRAVAERRAGEPVLDPRRTILFCAGTKWDRCHFFNVPWFRSYIRRAYRWAAAQGADTFVVDIYTPFGLLALETLLDLRKKHEFKLYVFQGSRTRKSRKSYRLILETEVEFIILFTQADYSYGGLDPYEAAEKITRRAGLLCTERGFQVCKRLPH